MARTARPTAQAPRSVPARQGLSRLVDRVHQPGWVLLPLRGFLGFTFTFAGLQKLANRAFFRASSPSSIQQQIDAASRASPIGGLLHLASHAAVAVGLLIALGELAVGLGTLLGLFSRVAAAGGMAISAVLFLSVSFHANPYFTGSDIVFLFAWTPLLVAGSGGVASLDALVRARSRRALGLAPNPVVPIDFATVRQLCGSFDAGRCRALGMVACHPGPCPVLATHPAPRPEVASELDRRSFLARSAAAGGVAAAGLAAAGLAAGLGRALAPAEQASSATPLLRPGGRPGATSPSSTAPTGSAPASGGARPPGSPIGPASDVPVGGAAQFQDPTTGDPAYAVQPTRGSFVAFDAVCPHAGCTVGVQSGQFVCPCHGSTFNLRTGAVENGPATTGLTPIRVQVGPDGQLYAT
jgi:thiosulfate dehydrogenase [quinone] large subunit